MDRKDDSIIGVGIFQSNLYDSTPELEFLDINWTKDSSLLLHDIHSPFYWRMIKKTILFSGFKNPYKNIREAKKIESISQ